MNRRKWEAAGLHTLALRCPIGKALPHSHILERDLNSLFADEASKWLCMHLVELPSVILLGKSTNEW